MAKLNKKSICEAQSLLNEYEGAIAALDKIGKKGWSPAVFVTNEIGYEDVTVGLDTALARTALNEQRLALRAKLAKLGIEVE